MITRLFRKTISTITFSRLFLVVVLMIGMMLGATSMHLMYLVVEVGESQGWIQPGGDRALGIQIVDMVLVLAMFVSGVWGATGAIRNGEHLLVLAATNAAEPLGREPLSVSNH